MTDSVFSSPARSWKDVRNGSLPDSENESDYLDNYLSIDISAGPDLTIISGWLKFRDQKKWKLRWGVVTKLSPAADCLHLQLYRDSRDRHKQGLTKASLSLQHFLGLETGFTLDKESNTIAVICQDLIVVLAFDTRERLIQWQVKIYNHLGEDQQFLIQISASPSKAKLSAGPAKLHIQEKRFCLTAGVPPKLAGCWEIKHLRRYGVVDGKFCFEGGSLCGKGEGLYVFLTDQCDDITRCVQLASDGKLNSLRRPLLRNMSVQHESPRKVKGLILRTETRLSEASFTDNCVQTQGTLRFNENTQPWPSMETQTDIYGHGDASSLADFSIDMHGTKPCNWGAENQLGRCVSCIGKLGLISRPSTAANTPGSMNFNPWTIEDSKICLTGMHDENIMAESEYVCDSSCISMSQKSKYSNSSSSGTESSEQPSFQYSLLENISKNFQTPISPPKNFQSNSSNFLSRTDVDSPPCRPPKPAKFRNHNSANQTPKKRINKPPMPLPLETEECSCKLLSLKTDQHQFDNNDSPTISESTNLNQKIREIVNVSQYYDTPRSIKLPLKETAAFANYDVPPAAIPLKNKSPCTSKMKIIMETHECKKMEVCLCHQLLRYPNTLMQLPFHLPCKNHWQNMDTGKTSEHLRRHPIKESPVYAQVDLSKKAKNRLAKDPNDKDKNNKTSPSSNNYMNIKFKGEDENYKHLTNLNYMNLEFTNSLAYYENVRELLNNTKEKERIDSLNIDLPTKMSCDLHKQIRVCHKCGHRPTNETKEGHVAGAVEHEKPKLNKLSHLVSSEKNTFENYVPMSPLKHGHKLSPEKSASNPILSESSALSDQQRKTSTEILGSKYSTLESFSRHNDRTDRRRSSSACSPKQNESDCKDDSLSISDSRVPVDSDSGLESDKLSQENDDTLENLRHRKDSILAGGIRRLSSIACKSSNRDSSSSNDSGFSSGSLKYPCGDFNEYEMPLTTNGSTKRHNSFNQHNYKNGDRCSPTPRRAKSSDPLRDLAFHFHKGSIPSKSSSAEAELPLYLSKRDLCKDYPSPADTTVTVPYVDCRSTSSGTSDMSDYIETLSISSHSSTDVHSADASRLHQSVVTALKPRSANEYQKVDRVSLLEAESKQM